MRRAALSVAAAAACATAGEPAVLLHPPSTVPEGWARVEGARPAAAERVRWAVAVRRGEAGVAELARTAAAVSDPAHPRYLRHMSWREAGDLLRPPAARAAAVDAWLASAGVRATERHPHGDYISGSATVEEIERLVPGAEFGVWRHAGSGAELARVTGGVRLPAAVAPHVAAFTGFHGFPTGAGPVRAAASAAGKVDPSLLMRQYHIPADVPKSGKTNIQAIAQFQGQYVKSSDLSSFCSEYVNGSSCKIAKYVGKNSGSAGVESMLDTEYIMGLGQGTETWVYSYPSMDFCADLLQWGSDVTVNSTFPYSISMSYGSQKIDFCDTASIQRLAEDVQKMATMGVTVMISSGDDGSGDSTRQGSNGGKLSPSYPASIPYAVAVGSTYFVQGTSGEEQATTQFGSGGGFSYDFPTQDYQKDAVAGYIAALKAAGTLPSKKYAADGRGSPDVALLGEQFTVVVNGGKESVGGTSASSPSFAAVVSLLNEVCLAAGGRTLGFANPLFYQQPGMFVDITKGTNAIGSNSAAGWPCTKGWDAATGLGVPYFPTMAKVVQAACSGTPLPPVPPSPTPPPPPPRYHCNVDTFQCESIPGKGHSTMAKCKAACVAPPTTPPPPHPAPAPNVCFSGMQNGTLNCAADCILDTDYGCRAGGYQNTQCEWDTLEVAQSWCSLWDKCTAIIKQSSGAAGGGGPCKYYARGQDATPAQPSPTADCTGKVTKVAC